MTPNLRASLYELVGSFAVVLATSGAVVANGFPALAGQAGFGRIGIALAAGCVYAAALAFTVRVSGGFLNPAITVTLWVFQRLDSQRAGMFIVAQTLGALLAGLALRGLFFVNENALLESRLGTPHLNLRAFDAGDLERPVIFQGIAIEGLLTFLLVFAIFALVFDSRFRRAAGETAHRLAYLWLGMLVTAVTLLAFDYTGAAMNPARWLGLVIWESTVAGLQSRHPWADHGPYWIGPILGSLLAGILYTYVLLPVDERKGPPRDGMP